VSVLVVNNPRRDNRARAGGTKGELKGMDMLHREKLRLARRMMTPKEIKEKKSPFDTVYWNNQHDNNAKKQLAQGKRKER